ncbi:tetratricopeptide repeat protein, partial [Fibrobacterota bacterium]
KARKDSITGLMKKIAPKEKKLLIGLEKARKDSIVRVEKARQDSIARVEKARQDSTAQVEKARQDSIAGAEKARKDSIALDLEIRIEEKFAAKPGKTEVSKTVKETAPPKKTKKDSLALLEKARKDSIAAIKDEKQRKKAEEQAFRQKITSIIKMEKVPLDTASLLKGISQRLEKKPGKARLLEARGILFFLMKDYKESQNTLKKLKRLTTNHHRIMALCFFHLGEHKRAIRHFKKIPREKMEAEDRKIYCHALVKSKQPRTAAWEYEELLKQLPEDQEALAYLIEFYRKPLKKNKLLSKLEAYAKIHPQDTGTYLELSSLFRKSHPDKAEKYREKYVEVKQKNKEAELEKANVLEGQGKKKEALAIYLNYAADFSHDYKFNLALADKLLAAGKKKESLTYYETAWDIKSADYKVITRMAGLYQQQKQDKKAMDAYTEALKLNPNDKDLMSRYMKLIPGMKDTNEMQTAYEFVVSLDSGVHQAQFYLAELYLKQKDKKSAYKCLQKALKSRPKNRTYLKLLPWTLETDEEIKKNFSRLKILGKRSDTDPYTKLLLAQAFALNKQNSAARKYYRQVYQKDKKLLKGRRRPVLIFFQSKKYSLAAELAREYLDSTDSRDREIREIQVKSYQKTKADKVELHKAMSELVLLDSGTRAWWLDLARLDLDSKDTTAALEHAKIWVERNPKSEEGYSFLLPLVSSLKEEEKTYMTALTRLIEIGPKQKLELRHLELGLLLYKQKNFPEAEKLLSKSTRAFSMNPELWYTLGKIYNSPEFKGTGKEQFQKANKLEPRNPEYARTYASFLTSDAEIKANLRVFKRLENNSPTDVERVKLAKSYYLNGDYASSARAWNELDSAIAKEPLALQCYLKLGQLEELIKNAAHFSNDYQVNLVLAQKLLKEGRKKTALRFYEIAWGLDSSNSAMLADMASIHEYLYHKQKAMETWETYGDLQLKSKNRNQAKSAYEHVLRLGEKDYKFKEQLMKLYLEDNDLDKLETMLKGILKEKADLHEAHFWMAKMYVKRNQSGKAVDFLNKAITYAPDNLQYIEMLGTIYYLHGELSKVVKVLGPVKDKLSENSYKQYSDAMKKLGKK